MCGEGHLENVANMCMEVSRVLRPNGIFMIISYRDDYFEVVGGASRDAARRGTMAASCAARCARYGSS